MLCAGTVGSGSPVPVHVSPSGPAEPPPPAATADGCGVLGDDVTADDAARAHSACRIARERFHELMGDPVPEVRVVVEWRQGYRTGTAAGRAVVLWPSSAAMTERVGTPNGGGDGAPVGPGGMDAHLDAHAAAQWREVLPHEIVHALLATRFYPEGELPGGEYGTPLPDWLEEGAAIWAEPLRSRRARLATARTLPRPSRDLRSILAGEHPAATDRDILTMRDGAAPPADEALWEFYPQSIAVVGFIYDVGGRRAFRELAHRLARDPDDARAVVGLPGLPAAMDELLRAWEDWLVGERPGG